MNAKWIHYLGLFIFITFISCTSEGNKDSKTVIKPNIIYIVADDLGYSDLGCYGQQIIKTPELDRMASEGMQFTDHYAGNAVCAPSRNNLMTGMHPGHASIRGNGCKGGCPMPDEDVTVAEYLKKAGYVTGLIGKWGNGKHGTEGFPTRQGFDFFYGYDNQILAHNYWPEYLWRNDEKEYLNNQVRYLDSASWHTGLGSYTLQKEEYSHDLFMREANNFIKNHQDTSFFLYLPLTIPHNNGEAPDGKRQEVPDYGIYAEKNWATDTMGYAAMITRMDQDVGEILDLLRQLGMAENTLVIFDSDNGSMQEWSGITEFFNSNGAFRGAKRDLYEGGIRVPMIAWWPGTIEPGTVTDHITASWDFLPTACEMAGLNIPDNTDGISFLPLLKNEKQNSHEFLYWEYGSNGGQQAVRMGKWKGIRHHLADNPDAPLELYNLEIDPTESMNFAEQHPEIVRKTQNIMQEEHRLNEQFLLPIDTTNIHK